MSEYRTIVVRWGHEGMATRTRYVVTRARAEELLAAGVAKLCADQSDAHPPQLTLDDSPPVRPDEPTPDAVADSWGLADALAADDHVEMGAALAAARDAGAWDGTVPRARADRAALIEEILSGLEVTDGPE